MGEFLPSILNGHRRQTGEHYREEAKTVMFSLIRHFIVRASSKLFMHVCTYGTTCCFTSFNPLVKSH